MFIFIVHLANNNVATLRQIDKVLSKEPTYNSIYNSESSSYRLLKEKMPRVNAEGSKIISTNLVILGIIFTILIIRKWFFDHFVEIF